MARRKKDAVEAPQNELEAIVVAVDYALLDRAVGRAEAICDEQIDQAKARRDENIATLKPKLDIAFEKLQAYYSANEDVLTGGVRRSVELGPVTIGERLTTPKLKLPSGMKEAGVIAWMRSVRDVGGFAKRFMRVRVELNKQAIIEALKPTDEPRTGQDMKDSKKLADKGLSIRQKDEFFVKVPEEEPAGNSFTPASSE
ncbi:host-nuclease inhibitor Gam family protein [Sphingorhabdus sp. 109]|uniref:host-nuclease inhibitor Gam family protein n=1 Tax=Sphingorhabdus sp. 109 TaxID=2653173 RepID=UPI0012F01A86|nr:host-nuclease inhibitor Gam family protein [Sphingorhabdus sp. 109]VWX62620.1 Phage host-nuclease inhibitor protein Gam [Sphingorhabdus sp. 109]